ncbi:hypothetical protein AHMF7605_28770 [Adhaeribacter arboris]|uniref:Uncharacterized protein n=1 Tax=Adhaeribacter arboris TaxID=2072846 RepID=A0A2T2Y8R5_9BACT|nr:hypothetical protein [Adhaeribacter arboris]PSR51905.1 hypothetical protein AHMF7605_28770 [Adhaeribacter arboris]
MKKEYFELLKCLGIGQTEIDANRYQPDIMRALIFDYAERHMEQFGAKKQDGQIIRPVLFLSGERPGFYLIEKNEPILLQLDFGSRISRAAVRKSIDALKPGETLAFKEMDAGLLSFVRTYCSKSGEYSVRKKKDGLTVEFAAAKNSIRSIIVNGLTNYAGLLIVSESNKINYVRSLVSLVNAAQNRNYSVKANGKEILIGLRSDIENYAKSSESSMPAHWTADDWTRGFIAAMRRKGYGRQEMRKKLDEYITAANELF